MALVACLNFLALALALPAGSDAATRPDAGTPADVGLHGDGAPVGDASVPPLVTIHVDPVAPSPAPRPRGRIRGTVMAKGTRELLAGVSVTVDAVAASETDAAGRFDIEVEPGRHNVQFQVPGHESLAVALTADAEHPTDDVFRMLPRLTGERYQTVVVAPDTQAPKITLREEELVRTPGSFGDPFRAIESLPGVSQVVWPLSLYAIRGANPGNTGFFLDGVRLPALFHFALGPSVIHPFFLQQVDFYPGGYPARYGRYIAGIVAGTTATPVVDRVHASADLRLIDVGGIVAAPWDNGRGAVAVAGRYSYTGLLVSALSSNYKLGYWDYQARIDHTLGPGRATVFAFGSADELGLKQELGFDGALQFHRLDLRWDGVVGGGRLNVGGVLGRDASQAIIKQLGNLPINARGTSVAPRLRYTRPLASWFLVEVGGDAEVQWFSPHTDKPMVEGLDIFRARRAVSVGTYLATDIHVGSRLVVSPALRVDAFKEQAVTLYEPAPRLQVRLRAVGDLWLKANVGRFAQMASLPLSIPGFEGFGLADFGTQTSRQGSAGVEAALPGDLSIDATGFYQRMRLTDLRSMFASDIAQDDLLELRDAESYGGEILIRRHARNRLSGWLAYTLAWSHRVVEGQIVASDWDQRNILNLVGNYRLRGGYSFGGRFHFNSGRPYPVKYERTSQVEYSRLPDFVQVDVRADKRFILDRAVVDVYVEFVNLTRSRQVVDWRVNSAGILNEHSFRLVLPSVGVHAEW